MNVRNATELDIPALLKMGILMHNESRYRKFDYNTDKVEQLIRHLIEEGIVLVVESKTKIIGGFIGMIGQHYFGSDKMSADLALFVNPDSRGTKAAILLIKEYIRQAKEYGVVDIGIGNSTGNVGGLYEKTGFTQVGGNYRLEGIN